MDVSECECIRYIGSDLANFFLKSSSMLAATGVLVAVYGRGAVSQRLPLSLTTTSSMYHVHLCVAKGKPTLPHRHGNLEQAAVLSRYRASPVDLVTLPSSTRLIPSSWRAEAPDPSLILIASGLLL